MKTLKKQDRVRGYVMDQCSDYNLNKYWTFLVGTSFYDVFSQIQDPITFQCFNRTVKEFYNENNK